MEAVTSSLFSLNPLTKINDTSLRSSSSSIRLATHSYSFDLSHARIILQQVWKNNWFAVEKIGVGKLKCSASTRHGTDGSAGGSLERKKLAVFVSGGGSNFQSIHKATVGELVNGDIAVVVTDKPGCGGAKYAADNGIPVVHFPKTKSAIDGITPHELVIALKNFKINFILLAGYLKLIPIELVRAFPRFILNIHPALLPAFGGKGFYGMKVHQAVIASGARYSGPTVHFVDEQYDSGCILAQRIVPVLADDSAEQLAKRVLHEEHKVYVEVVAALCEERIVWREDGVPVIRSKENPNVYS